MEKEHRPEYIRKGNVKGRVTIKGCISNRSQFNVESDLNKDGSKHLKCQVQ